MINDRFRDTILLLVPVQLLSMRNKKLEKFLVAGHLVYGKRQATF